MENQEIICSPCRYGNIYHYKNDQFIGRSLELYGEYCEAEIQVTRPYIDDDAVVYDVGSNIGSHAVAFSKIVPRGKVFAFEPNPKNYQLLCNNIAVNECTNLRAFNVAVLEQTGETTIEDFDETASGNFGVIRAGTGGLSCAGVALDDLDIPAPDFLKVDVEGFETGVLKGAQKKIDQKRPVIFYEAQEAPTLEGCYNFLKERDYLMYWVVVYNYSPSNFNKNPVNIYGNSGVANILALPAERPDQPGALAPVIGPGDTIGAMFRRVAEGMLPYRVVF